MRASGDPLLHQPQALFRVALVAHLGHDLVLPRGLGQRTRLADRCVSAASARTRACPAASPPSRRPRDCGRASRRRTASMSFCFSSICRKSWYMTAFENFSGMPFLAMVGLGGVARVAVAERDDVVAGFRDVIQVRRAHAVRVPDDRDVHGVAGRLEACAEHVPRQNRDTGRGRGGASRTRGGKPGGGLLVLAAHRVLSWAAPSRGAAG